MLKPHLLLFSLCVSFVSHAANVTPQELQALSQQEANASFFSSLSQMNTQSFQKSQQYQDWAQSLEQQAMQQIKPKNPEADASGIMIFASLGMPKTALKQLMQQASDLNVPVVIRGLWENDFAATVNKVQSLILSEDGDTILGGVEINPVWFKQFNIQQVPAFVAINKGQCIGEPPCDAADYDIVYGNVSLYNALETIANKGAYPEIARAVLSSR
ncbi:type-F conjugative transfer system pilin assembly protein TrbC [Aliivibrio wodanis]|uniref:type-F conjugative transfer system pilin assembly protein TrbC n=1 Tax=Aliivibrio wodanis TaxID=80852 RepID=UPI00406D02F8